MAEDDFYDTDEDTPLNGNVLDNDSTGYDEGATVTKISFNGNTYDVPSSGQAPVNGQYGVLKIAANGSYTYTSYNSATGTDQFTYTMRDYDTDTDTAPINNNRLPVPRLRDNLN